MKRYLLTLAVVAITGLASAQFKYGPKVGVNTSNFENEKIIPGFHFGGFLTTELADRLGIQADFVYTFKGSRFETKTQTASNQTVTATTTRNYRFVEVPVMFYFPISDHIRGFLGPQLNFYRRGNQKVEASGKTTETKLTGSGQMSWCAGFDLVLDSPITIGARFVSNRFSDKSAGGAEGTELRLRSVLISVGYRLDW